MEQAISIIKVLIMKRGAKMPPEKDRKSRKRLENAANNKVKEEQGQRQDKEQAKERENDGKASDRGK